MQTDLDSCCNGWSNAKSYKYDGLHPVVAIDSYDVVKHDIDPRNIERSSTKGNEIINRKLNRYRGFPRSGACD